MEPICQSTIFSWKIQKTQGDNRDTSARTLDILGLCEPANLLTKTKQTKVIAAANKIGFWHMNIKYNISKINVKSIFESELRFNSQLSISLQFNQHNKQINDTAGSHVVISIFEIITGRATPAPKPIPTNNSLQLFFSFMFAMLECTNKR